MPIQQNFSSLAKKSILKSIKIEKLAGKKGLLKNE